MIKKLKKLAALTILSIILSINFMPVSFAVLKDNEKAGSEYQNTKGVSNLGAALDNTTTEENECIPENLIKGKYFFTIIEEPLTPSPPLSREQFAEKIARKDKFITQTCFRNTFSFSILLRKGTSDESRETETIATLSKICSEEASKLVQTFKYNDDINVVFNCEQVQVFLSQGGTSLLEAYIKTIYTWGASLVGLIAVVIIVASGIQISISGGDSAALDSAKSRIIKSIAGIAILFLSGIILYTINPNFFVAPGQPDPAVTGSVGQQEVEATESSESEQNSNALPITPSGQLPPP